MTDIPMNKEAEDTVLSILMNNRETIDTAIRMLDDKCFYYPANDLIFNAICRLYQDNAEVDMITLEATLEGKKFDKSRIFSLDKNFIISSNIEYHCKILIEYKNRRTFYGLSKTILNNLQQDTFDSNEILSYANKTLFDIHANNEPPYYLLKNITTETFQYLKDIRENQTFSIDTGFLDLDKTIGGFLPGQFIVVGARTGQGKTSFALDIAVNIARRKIPILYFSLEMSNIEITKRLVSKESPENLKSLKYRSFQKGELDVFWTRISNGMNRISQYPFLISDKGALNLQDIQSRIETAIREHDIKLIVIDYLQLVDGNTSEGRRLEIESITRALKRFSLQYKITVLSLSQLSRGIDHRGEEQRPVLADLRESGSIEQDADVVMFIHNASALQKSEYGLPTDNNNENIREILVRKNRNGECANILVLWEPEYAQFRSLFKDNYGEQ